MQSRTPFRPNVFSTLLIAALLAAAALLADTARADHFTETGGDSGEMFSKRDDSPFGVMCITLGGARRNCGDAGFLNSTHVCDMRGATITTFVNGVQYNGCRSDYASGDASENTDFVTAHTITACSTTDSDINAIGPIP